MKQILIVIILGCLFTSCSEEIYDSIAGNGNKVKLKLSYQELISKDTKVTRSTTKATDDENALYNLQVFVFNTIGKLIGYKWISGTENLNQKGEATDVIVNTVSGQAYIYGVANIPTAIYSLSSNETMIPTSSDEAWNEDDVQDGKSSFTLDDLKAIIFKRKSGEINITDINYMMSGMVDNGNAVTIEKDGSVTDGKNLIELKRIVSKVKFRITAGSSKITFTPTTYEIKNIPQTGELIYDANNVTEPTGFESFSGTFVGDNKETETINGTTTTYHCFTKYLPENRQNQNLTATISTWKDREKDNGETEPDKDKAFVNAPTNATYVAIRGKYKGPLSTSGKAGDDSDNQVDGDVVYYIHLGNFGSSDGDGNLSDFNVERNYYYTYTITINGLNDIWAEVEAENQDNGSSEGLVFNLSEGTVTDLDSHYDQVEMTFSNKDVTTDPYNSDRKFIYFMAKDVYDETGMMKIYSDDRGNTFTIVKGREEKKVEESDVEKLSSLSWFEFCEGSDKTYTTSTTSGKGWNQTTTYTKTKTISLLDLLKALIKKGNSTTWSTTYTCFANENYYEGKNWKEFVNQDQRYAYICRDMTSSDDTRNVRGAVIYGIRQYSIQTFYNTDYGDGGTDDIVAYGCETDYDDNYGCKARKSSNKKTLSHWDAGSGTDPWDGLDNMRTDLDRVSSWNNINYTYAKYACMSRNRDLDGDGTIDNDEIRWYCPTIQQYTGLWIGNEGLPINEARLFSGKKADITISDYSWNGYWYAERSTPAIHYYANDGSTRIYWAEEGGSVGSVYYSNVPHAVRCVRNLQSNNNGSYVNNKSVEAEKYYDLDDDNHVISFPYVIKSALKTAGQIIELGTHTELSTDNKPASKFYYATGTTTSTASDVTTGTSTQCSSYKENNNDNKWRAPNQRELQMMSILKVLGSDESLCRTVSSNTKLNYSWWAYNSYIAGVSEDNKGVTYNLRCVRDHEDMSK